MIRSTQISKITFTMGPISVHQFSEFSKHGVNALRIFQYIRTMQGLKNRNTKSNHSDWVVIGNKNLYNWFGVWSSKKHIILKKLAENKLIELNKRGVGRAPEVRIICPTKILN